MRITCMYTDNVHKRVKYCQKKYFVRVRERYENGEMLIFEY